MKRPPHVSGWFTQLPLGVLLLAPAPALAGPPDGSTAAPAVDPAAQPQPQPQPAAAPTAEPAPAPVYQPPPPQPVPPPPPNRNRGLGLTIAGATIFGFSYLISAITATILIDTNNADIGRPLLIPVAGPFIAIGRSGSATAGFGLGFAGVTQLAGLGMAVGGGVMLGRSRRQAQLSAGPGGLRLRF